MADDDWEVPTEFWQVCSESGTVVNVGDSAKDFLLHCIKERISLATVLDIYGDEAILVVNKIAAMTRWTLRGSERYQQRERSLERF